MAILPTLPPMCPRQRADQRFIRRWPPPRPRVARGDDHATASGSGVDLVRERKLSAEPIAKWAARKRAPRPEMLCKRADGSAAAVPQKSDMRAEMSYDRLMALNFPNLSRSYDAKGHCVRFWGYDEVLEIPFFVEEGALSRIHPQARGDEAGFERV
jgi:Protein of unknown function (DUF1488)